MKFSQRIGLFPFEWGFKTGVFFRNLWYDYIYKGKKFPVKIISIGNLSVGGTGKTPMAEWLIQYATSKNIRCAYLSRGYGRRTQGFWLVNPNQHTALEVGDEALQVASNFNVPVAVCENRIHGVKSLLEKFPDLQLIILDDAFQHRKIFRDLDIVMIDPSKSPFEDFLLPTGKLREPVNNLKRADLVIFSKINLVSESDLKKIQSKIKTPKSSAKLVSIALKNCFEDTQIPLNSVNRNPCFAVSGIGNNELFIKQLYATKLNVVGQKTFKDHYMIKENEIQNIVKKCQKLVKSEVFHIKPIIVITEKDYYRLKNQPYFQQQEIPFYYLKVGFEFEHTPSVIENFFYQF